MNTPNNELDKIENILHLNGCQQRTAGYNEALDGKELDTDDMERMEALTFKEIKQAINEYVLGIIGEKIGRERDPNDPEEMTDYHYYRGWNDCIAEQRKRMEL